MDVKALLQTGFDRSLVGLNALVSDLIGSELIRVRDHSGSITLG